MQNVFYDKSNQETFIFMLSPYEICVCYYFLTLGINNPEGFKKIVIIIFRPTNTNQEA